MRSVPGEEPVEAVSGAEWPLDPAEPGSLAFSIRVESPSPADEAVVDGQVHAAREPLDEEGREAAAVPEPAMDTTTTTTHTDSLVTIRLSDADAQPVRDEAFAAGIFPVDGATDIPPSKPVRAVSLNQSSPARPRVRFSAPEHDSEDGSRGLARIRTTQSADNLDEKVLSGQALCGASSEFATDDPVDVPAELERQQHENMRRSDSTRSIDSTDSNPVDWEVLDKNEQDEIQCEQSDETTTFLLARLDRENNALATDPKSGISKVRARSRSRPPSIQYLKKLIDQPARASLRYSQLPVPPPMTELEFWSALVRDYKSTAQRLPTLTSTKIRAGIPPPLRGVVWMSIAGARESYIGDEYDRLCGESSPYEKLIGKDIGRSFPGVDMFRDPDGDGQKMLGKVLNAFSLWDQEIGYCQGLGFVVGPLIMHMGDKDAFCVLVRLMDHYDLRSCFLPDLSGLHQRIYQFQHLLAQHLPKLTAHLEQLKVEPLYCSQWFLSFFGVTCPLPMLIRIYDIILTEGASETLMRVALSLMRRNEQKILAAVEFEDIMQLLLSRSLWDTYGCNADDLVNDFCGWTGLVTRERLQALETSFRKQAEAGSSPASKPGIHSAASRFLGRFWAGAQAPKSAHLTNPSLAAPQRPASFLRRTPSKQSMASTLNSIESAESNPSHSTDVSNMSTPTSADWVPIKPTHAATMSVATTRGVSNRDRDLHGQIEDLLTALSDMQREHSLLASELQREREERDEDRAVVQRYIVDVGRQECAPAAVSEDVLADVAASRGDVTGPTTSKIEAAISRLEERFADKGGKRSSLLSHSKHQLRDEAFRWKEQYEQEAARSRHLNRQLTDSESETNRAREDLREARCRIQESHREKQRLEKNLQELRKRKSAVPNDQSSSGSSGETDVHSPTTLAEHAHSSTGLREFRLGRAPSSKILQQRPAQQQPPMTTTTVAQRPPSQSPSLSSTAASTPTTSGPTPTFSKRTSSLHTQAILATEQHQPIPNDTLLLELVNSKTAEAVAKQELEEVKGKLESLRKLLGGRATSPDPAGGGGGGGGGSGGNKRLTVPKSPVDPPRAGSTSTQQGRGAAPAPAIAVGGGFFSGWGKRSTSTTAASGAGGSVVPSPSSSPVVAGS